MNMEMKLHMHVQLREIRKMDSERRCFDQRQPSTVIKTSKFYGAMEGIMAQMFYMLCGNVPGAEVCCGYLLEALLKQVEMIVDESTAYVEEEQNDRYILAKQIDNILMRII